MNTLDIILLVLLAIGFYFGYKKGFLTQLASILGLGIAYVLSGTLSGKLHLYLVENNVLQEDTSKWISYVLCFVGIIILIKLLNAIIVKFLTLIGLNFINKFAGAGLNTLKWAIVLSILMYFASDLNIFDVIELKDNTISYYLYSIGEVLMRNFFS